MVTPIWSMINSGWQSGLMRPIENRVCSSRGIVGSNPTPAAAERQAPQIEITMILTEGALTVFKQELFSFLFNNLFFKFK